MNKILRFGWLAFGAASALLLGACVAGDEEEGAGTDIVLDEGMSPASGEISVKIAVVDPSVSQSESVTLDVTFTNNSARMVRVPGFYAPSDEIEEDLFVVTYAGQDVDFTGPHYKRPALEDADYLVLGPGKSVTRAVTLSGFYDLSETGDYAIRYQAEMLAEKSSRVISLDSNEVKLWIEGRANAPVPQFIGVPGPAGFTSSVSFNKCTTAQQDTIFQAIGSASTMADGATAYLGGAATASPRYTTWFGAFSSSGWNTAKSHYTAIKDAIDTKALNFDCGCKKKYYAYVYPNQPYNVYLCSVFWQAPLSGTDSKGGTLIHELSHFDVVAGTDDWVYGQSGAKSLAISDPTKALNNADSHEYFAENTPFLQ